MMEQNKNHKKIIITIIVTILVLLIALLAVLMLKDKNKTMKETTTTEKKEVQSKYRMSSNNLEDFDLTFLKLETNYQNIVYSPLSIKYALAMLKEGTKGETKAQIDALIGDYKSKKYQNNTNMSFANAIFIKNTFKDYIKESYQNTLKEKYNAEIIYDDFSSPDNVNSWVSNKTFNLINNLVDDVSSNQFMLINALAIDMEWNKRIQADSDHYEDQYDISYMHEKYSAFINVIMEDFYETIKFDNNRFNAKAVEFGASINNYDIVTELGENNIRETISKEYQEWLKEGACGGEQEDVTTFVNRFIEELNSNYKRVDTSTDFKFHSDQDVNVFSKELKEYNGTTLEYIAIMPKTQSLNTFIKNADAKSINNIIDKIKPIQLENFEQGKVTKITGKIPLFKYEYKLDLKSDLRELGITDVFDINQKDLSGITKDPSIVIGDASHKANIEFSNEGIKAAAATQAGGMGAAGCYFEHLYEVPIIEIDLTFDKPYLYIIRDKDSGEIWFIGTVYQPTEK